MIHLLWIILFGASQQQADIQMQRETGKQLNGKRYDPGIRREANDF